jgi:predicted metal-dependent phosphoesterase TrpH
MSCELVRRITVKKDGVYLCSHSNNDTSPFLNHRIRTLSEAYEKGGQAELDREIIEMLMEYARPVGNHHSVTRYQEVIWSADAKKIMNAKAQKIHDMYNILTKEDLDTEWLAEKDRTPAMQQYFTFARNTTSDAYTAIAALLKPPVERTCIKKVVPAIIGV